MTSKRKPKSKLHLLAIVWGAIFTAFMILVLGVKTISEIIENGPPTLGEFLKEFTQWDNPGPYFYTYMIGYVIIWWKPLWGSIIIILASIFLVIMAGFNGPPIFAAPGFLVGLLYLINSLILTKERKPHNLK